MNTDNQTNNRLYHVNERRGLDLKIIVYYPKDPVSIDILQRKVATVHAEAAIKYINKLPCPKEQKIELVNSLIKKDLPR